MFSCGSDVGTATLELQGSPAQLQQRPSSGNRSVNSLARRQQEQQHHHKPDVPNVPMWEGGNLRAGLRAPPARRQPRAAAKTSGLSRSASAPGVQRPSSAPAAPTGAKKQAEVKKDQSKHYGWYVPEGTYRTQYMEDYSEVQVQSTNGPPRPASAVEIRRELDKRFAQQSMMQGAPSKNDLINQMRLWTSETTAQFRKFTQQEASDCRGTLSSWQTNKGIKNRTDRIIKGLAEARQSREARSLHRRPPKVPMKQEGSTSCPQRLKSPTGHLNVQTPEAPVLDGSLKGSCSLDSARTINSSTTASSSGSTASGRSSGSSASVRTSSSNRSGPVRSKSMLRSSSKT